MSAGTLDRRIEIVRLAEEQDETSGEVRGEWVTFAKVWAMVRQLRPWRKDLAQEVAEGYDTRFKIRYLAGIKADMRIVYEERTYDIRLPVELGRRAFMEILATARGV